MGNIVQLGCWVPCGSHLHVLNMACSDFIRRERIGLNGRGHEHYVVCGCRWNDIFTKRTRRCKRHQQCAWES